MNINRWQKSPVPDDRYVICISSCGELLCDWIFVGKKSAIHDEGDTAETKFGVAIGWVKFWHELPDPPCKFKGKYESHPDWISCRDFPAPSWPYDSLNFLLFDGEKGIVEAENWGGYHTDVVSCKFGYKDPLFWRPFPLLPIKSYDVLQIDQ